jgi:hypothetical protein
MNPLERHYRWVCRISGKLNEILQVAEPAPPKTGPALLLSDCSLGDVAAIRDAKWQPSIDDDQGEALEPVTLGRWVSSLGINERDAQWVSATNTRWKWDNGRWWKCETAGIWQAAPWGYTPAGAAPYVETTAQPLSWRGWAVPAISDVLANYAPMHDEIWADWIDRVAPLIADRIACDPQRAMEVLRNHQSDKVNR